MGSEHRKAEIGILQDLQRGGVALDGHVLENVRSASARLSICQTRSVNENYVFELDSGGCGYMLSVAIQNHSSGRVYLDEFRLQMLWSEHGFSWLRKASRNVPWAGNYGFPSPGVVGLEPEDVLNRRVGAYGRLNSGGAIEGLLLGIGEAAIPAEYRDGQRVQLRLEIFDRPGNCYSRLLNLRVSRRAARATKLANIYQVDGKRNPR
jgi:hypothetical protein